MAKFSHRGLLFNSLFLLLAFLYIHFSINPLGLPAPLTFQIDYLICFSAALLLRKPNFLPTLLIVFIWLVQDFLYGFPLGLWTLVAVVILEILRALSGYIKYHSFLTEWVLFGTVYLGGSLIHFCILLLTFSGTPPIAQVLSFAGLSILIYPIFALISHFSIKWYQLTFATNQSY